MTPVRRPLGFSLLEVQISALMAAFVFAGMALTLKMQGDQITWLEDRAAYRGTTAPVSFVAIEPQLITPGISGRFTVDVQNVVEEGNTYTVTVLRRSTVAGDCGY